MERIMSRNVTVTSQYFHINSTVQDDVIITIIYFKLQTGLYPVAVSVQDHTITNFTYTTITNFAFIPDMSNSIIGKDIEYSGALKNGVFWDVTRCGSGKNGRFGGT
jgi:hypothetical protein